MQEKKRKRKRNDCRNSKDISDPSLMWAVWGHFQGGSLCLTSSVCWFFRLTSSVALCGGGDAANK